MALTDDDIKEFIRLYREEFGQILPFDDARRRAEEVMTLLEMLAEHQTKVRTEEQESSDDDPDKKNQGPFGFESHYSS
jgi:hypothetical protein